jgi:hypothetical protein
MQLVRLLLSQPDWLHDSAAKYDATTTKHTLVQSYLQCVQTGNKNLGEPSLPHALR